MVGAMLFDHLGLLDQAKDPIDALKVTGALLIVGGVVLVRGILMADVVIVGGGVIGCSIAYHLAAAGASVTLFERNEVAGEASGAAAGMLAPLSESPRPGPFVELCLASLRLFPALADALREETGIDIEYLPSGILRVALTEDEERELRHRLEWQRSLGLPLEWVDGEALRRLEPRLAPARGALYSPQEHQVSAGRLTQALAQAAARRGAVFRAGRGGDRPADQRSGGSPACARPRGR